MKKVLLLNGGKKFAHSDGRYNTTLHEAMTGVEFPTYAASFKQWFGVDLATPAIGFPVEFK